MYSPIQLIGIGASAGGLEALQKLVAKLDPDWPLSYIVTQHLSPSHHSLLTELLARQTSLSVKELNDNQKPEKGTIYIVPPNTDAILADGVLCLFAPEYAVGPKPSIDRLFLSLAYELGAKAIGIILSGTGGDGSRGLREIKNAGGIAIVQDPATSKFSGMPNAALQDSRIDYIVSPEEIGAVLEAYVNGKLYEPVPLDGSSNEYNTVIQAVFNQTGIDLSGYKTSTLTRRLQRRMQVVKSPGIQAYVDLLSADTDEASSFARDMLISVTEFFRDQTPFAALSKVIEEYLVTSQPNREIRIWNPGCATGEETYSIAIVLEEIIRKLNIPIQYKIFATDIDAKALYVGRNGAYHVDSCLALQETWRERYFDQDKDYLIATKDIRKNIVFSQHNLAQDPPFSRIDLISCRNLLIYFNSALQVRILDLFNYALNPNGILLLGKSETIELHKDLFVPIDREARLFRKQPNFNNARVLSNNFESPSRNGERNVLITKPAKKTLDQTVHQFVLEQFAPPGLVVNQIDEVLYITGNVDPYITFHSGPTANNVFNVLKDEFRAEARALMHKCRRDKVLCVGSTHKMPGLTNLSGVRLTVRTMTLKKDHQPSEIVILNFESINLDPKVRTSKRKSNEIETISKERLEELERDLAASQEQLQIVIEELETSNEELQSLTEELQSSNEELQSANEELQTSNEELQSTNEELLTVNEEMEVKSRELESALDDLYNILNNFDHPLLVIDKNLRITQYVPAAEQLIEGESIRHGEIITALSWKVEIPDLRNILRKVMDTGSSYQGMIDCNGRHYQLLIKSYQSENQQTHGAVLSFPEVTELTQALKQVSVNENHLNALINSVLVGIINIDVDGTILKINITAEKMFGYESKELEGQPITKLMPQEHADKHHLYIDHYLRTGQKNIIGSIRELEGKRKDGTFFPMELAVNEIVNKDKKMFCGVINEITKRKTTESLLDKERLRAIVTLESINDAVITIDTQHRIEYINPVAEKLTGFHSKSAKGMDLANVFQIYDAKAHFKLNEQLVSQLQEGKALSYNDAVLLKHVSDTESSIELSIAPLISKQGKYLGSVLSFNDVTNKQTLLQQMTWQACHDPLTGLVNRKEFENRLEHALVSAHSFERNHAVLYLDLDQFKIVNDTCGHHAGDELLRQLANILCTNLRNRDTLARMGGDEFAVLLENTDLTQAEDIAEKLTEIVSDFRFSFEDRIFKIGVSIGVVPINSETVDARSLLSDADSACYVAKETGRNRVQIHTPDNIDLQSRRRDMHWVNRINNAIDENRLVLYFQNIKSLKDDNKLHYEVLIRLIDENGDLVPPGAFLPAAERYGLMTNIDQWVLKRLFTEIQKFESIPQVSVNLSGMSLVNPRFFAYCAELMKLNISLANKICFEITETAAITNFTSAQEFIRGMKKFGCLFALDDFGSGMCSFGYLKNLPVDFLKIDGAFVKDILHDQIDLFMVESVNRIGQLMNMKTIAECAESNEIVEKLAAIGVDYAQGYCIGNPIPFVQFVRDLEHYEKVAILKI